MIFKIVAALMCGVAAMFASSVDIEYAFYAALIPGAAAIGLMVLASS